MDNGVMSFENVQRIKKISRSLPPSFFDAIVLSGGGFKGLIELGVMQYYVEMGILVMSNVKELAGTSIGGVCCLLMCVGYTPKEVFQYVCFNDLFNVSDVNTKPQKVNTQMGSTHSPTKSTMRNDELRPPKGVGVERSLLSSGAMSLDPFLDKISDLLIKKLGYVPTLNELYLETGKILKLSMSNVSKKNEEILYYESHPNLNCVTAVGYSCSLPMVFHKATYVSEHGDTDIVADGALVNNFPWDYISDGCNSILGVYLGGNDEIGMFSEGSTLRYLYNLIMISHTQLTHLRLDNASDKVHLVSCYWPGNVIKFKMTHIEKMSMFVYGWSCGERCYNTKKFWMKGL